MKKPLNILIAALAVALAPLVPASAGWLMNSYRFGAATVPFAFRTVLTDVTNESPNNWTFTAADLGPAGATKRVFVGIGWAAGTTAGLNSVTIGGVTATAEDQNVANVARQTAIYSAVVSAATGDIVIDPVGAGTRVAIAIWSGDLTNAAKTDSGNHTVTTTTDLAIANLAIDNGGVMLCSLFSGTNGVTEQFTWTGADTMVERADADIEANSAYAFADIIFSTETSTTLDLTVQESSTSSRVLACVTWL